MAMNIAGLNRAVINTRQKLEQLTEDLEEIKSQMTEDLEKIKSKIYPVGSIYISLSNEDPKTLFGGEWEKLEDRFLLSSSTTYKVGDIGGESEHKLSIDEMPMHAHTLGFGDTNTGNNGLVISYGEGEYRALSIDSWSWQNVQDKNNIFAQYAGENKYHNNMPPYLVVNMWKRTA